MAFSQATRKQARLRVALGGTAGRGKTYSGIWLASLFGKKVGVIDSERGRASLYALNPGESAPSPEAIAAGNGRFEFLVRELDEKSPQEYIEVLGEAQALGIDALVVDSYSHSWIAALEAVDRGGGWTKAGKSVSPIVAKLVDRILSYPGHVICTFREKAEYAIQPDEKGRMRPVKLGMAPVVRDGTDYEFTMWFDFDDAGYLIVRKTSCGGLIPMEEAIHRSEIPRIAAALKSWLADGVPESPLDYWTGRIRFAADTAQLEAVGVDFAARVKSGTIALTPEQRAAVKGAYLRRKQELVQADDGSAPP